jgi:hypothetical protein
MAITEIPTDSRCGCLWVGETGLFVQPGRGCAWREKSGVRRVLTSARRNFAPEVILNKFI